MLKTALVDALQEAFQAYPVPDIEGINVGIEYPVREEQFPCVWVNFAPTSEVQMIGINNREHLGFLPPPPIDPQATFAGYSRGFVEGQVSFTIGALSSLERDRIYDQVIRVGMLGEDADGTSVFRQQIEESPYANIGMRFDMWQTSGDNAAPGTPWGTDEMLYEITVATQLHCEFYVAPKTGQLVLLSEINVEQPGLYFDPATGTDPDPVTWPGVGTPSDL